MASPGAIASSLKHYCWNPRKSDFFPSFEAQIELDKAVIRPYKPVTGVLKLDTSRVVKFYGGIRIQLDANVKLRFQSKLDNRVSVNWAVESILQDAPEPDDGNYIESPVRVQLMGDENDLSLPCTMEPGTYTFPFSLRLFPKDDDRPCPYPVPAPFHSQFGSLQFHIAAYMGSAYCYVQIAQRVVGFGGFLDLFSQEEGDLMNQEVSITSNLHESIFSFKPMITFTLKTERRGYHPGEDVNFTLEVDNPKGKIIKNVKISLVRKVTYKAQHVSKSTTATIDDWTWSGTDELHNNNGPPFEGTLNIPKPCIPTYIGKPIYNVVYLLQYNVKVGGHPALGKGSLPLTIGTTKPSAVLLVRGINERRESVLNPAGRRKGGGNDDDEVSQIRPRSYSMMVRSTRRRSSILGGGSGGGIKPVMIIPDHHHQLLSPPSSHHHRTLSMMSVRELKDVHENSNEENDREDEGEENESNDKIPQIAITP